MATNKTNGKIYIGQTRTQLPERMKKHFSKIDDGTYFHNALKKYGQYGFRWEIIKIAESQDQLNNLEAECIKKYDSMNVEIGYNLTSGGESFVMAPSVREKASKRMMGQKPSQETREKMSESHKGKPGYWKGKRPPQHVIDAMVKASKSPEAIEKMRESKLGSIPWNKGNGGYKTVPCSEEKKEKLKSAAFNQWHNNTKKVVCIETNEIFPSAHRVFSDLGIKNVYQSCTKGYAAGGYHWKFLEN